MSNRAIVFGVRGFCWATEMYAIEVIQGLANRDGAKLMFGPSDFSAAADRPGSWWNQNWIEIYEKEYNFKFERMTGFHNLLECFKDKIKGYVIFDPSIDGTRCVAMTLAGTDDLLPVTKQMLEGRTDNITTPLTQIVDVPVKYDLTGKFNDSVEVYEWALGHVMPKCNRKFAHTPSGPDVDGIRVGLGPFRSFDWTIMHKGFIFNLTLLYEDMKSFAGHDGRTLVKGNKRHADMYRKILSALEKPAFIFGYGEFEWEWFMLLGEYGHYYYHWGDNMSFHNKVKPHNNPPRQQKHYTPQTTRLPRDKYYICFVTSEGDTMKGPIPFFFRSWLEKDRGCIPMNWTFHPLMVHWPAMLEYYYRNATENDYFIACSIYNFESPHFKLYTDFLAPDYRNSDLLCIALLTRGMPAGTLDYFSSAVNSIGIAAPEWMQEGKKSEKRILPDGTPFNRGADNLGYWQAKITGHWNSDWVPLIKDLVKRKEIIGKLVANIEDVTQYIQPPHIITVYADTHNCDELCKLHKDIADALNPDKFVAARMDEAFAAIKKWSV